jgi:hypothetical protein
MAVNPADLLAPCFLKHHLICTIKVVYFDPANAIGSCVRQGNRWPTTQPAAGFPIATLAFSARARLIRAISSVDGHSGERDAFQPIRTDPHDDCGDSCRSNYSQIGGKQVKRRFHCRGDGFLPERLLHPLRSSAAKWRDILWWLRRTANNIITSGRIAFHGFGLISRVSSCGLTIASTEQPSSCGAARSQEIGADNVGHQAVNSHSSRAAVRGRRPW